MTTSGSTVTNQDSRAVQCEKLCHIDFALGGPSGRLGTFQVPRHTE